MGKNRLQKNPHRLGRGEGSKVCKVTLWAAGREDGGSQLPVRGGMPGATYQFTSVASSLTRLYASLHASLSILVAMGPKGRGRSAERRGAGGAAAAAAAARR